MVRLDEAGQEQRGRIEHADGYVDGMWFGTWSHVLQDDADRPRLVLRQRTFAECLELAVAQPRIHCADDPYVVRALLSLLHSVAWIAERPDELAAIDAQLARTRHAVSRGPLENAHKNKLLAVAVEVADAIRGR